MKAAIRGFNPPPKFLAVGRCATCGKASYISRRDAKRAAKGMFPGLHHRPVQCGNRWHIQQIRGGL